MRIPDLAIRDSDVEARLRALPQTPLNFDPATLDGPGWERDDYRQRLPSEQPGPPEPGGSWETAARLSANYAFADPSLVEARFDPEVPLAEREMLLILKALGARIYAGVRVAEARDERRVVDGREAHVSFWTYRTLEGHVEAGQRAFEVWKWLESGDVEFRTHAHSRPSATNPVVLLGFRLLGRHKQVEFGRRACARMALLTEAALRRPDDLGTARGFDGRLLAIYLRDHHALLIALRELAGRMASDGRSPGRQAFAVELRAAAADDAASLEGILARVGSTSSQARGGAAWASEKLGRLKLNGRLVRPSPLSAVTELEGCRLLLESARAVWSGLAGLALGPDDAGERCRRATRLLETAERLRLAALAETTHPHGG